jgi:CrcB protein
MINAAAVGLGGFIGAVLRYLVSFAAAAAGLHGAIGTFTVNFAGCFLIGILAELDFTDFTYMRCFLIAGILGGFTTFSAFGLEAVAFIKAAQYAKAFIYVTGTLFTCIAAVAAGAFSAKFLN